MNIQSIKAFNDNYIWLISTNEGNLVIDPGESAPVLDYLTKNSIELTDILLTHHHYDHVGGVAELKKSITGKVIGPNNVNIEGIDQKVSEGALVNSCGLNFRVIEIPGHTLDHIAYFSDDNKQPLLFCGDTLFSAGCGRVFEGTFQQMYESIMRIKSLPINTLIYCGHEYTLANLKFALQVEPNNADIKNHIEFCKKVLQNNQATLPSSLQLELKINPFLRCDDNKLRASISHKYDSSKSIDDSSVFEYLRKWKDSF